MAMITGAGAVIQALEECDVEHVFGVPGTHNLELYRHLQASRIRHVLPRHEQGAGYAADGYARSAQRPGVVLTTSGPGLLNACAAAATSYAEFVPVLYLSPGPETAELSQDRGTLHEMKDQSGVFERIVDRSVRVDSVGDVYRTIHEVFARWKFEAPRPVHIEIPHDVLTASIRSEKLPRSSGGELSLPHLCSEQLEQAANLLLGAQRVVIVAGRGACGASDELVRLAETLDAIVVSTMNGKGSMPEGHRLSAGAVIRFGAAHDAIEAADAVVVVGTRLGPAETWAPALRPRGHVVRIDLSADRLDTNLKPHVGLHGDAAQVLSALAERIALAGGADARRGAARAAKLHAACIDQGRESAAPYDAYLAALSAALPADTIVAGDSAQVSYLATAHLWTAQTPGSFLYPAVFATLGYGIPAAVGASLARPDCPVIVLVGDGGTMFSIQELVTAVELGLPLPVVVFDNGGFGEIRDGMDHAGIARIAVDFPCPDLCALARACGGAGERVEGPQALADAVVRALQRSVPTVIQVPIGAHRRGLRGP